MPTRHHDASLALASLDPIMGEMVARFGPMRPGRRPGVGGRFEKLAESIAHQQLAGRAAATIWGRVRSLFGAGPMDPGDVLGTPEQALRSAGLSGAKVAALLDLALHVSQGSVDLDRAGRCSDEEVIAQLVRVRGIGTWTAQMFLLFTLQRLDVWPAGDLGVRVGYGRAYGLADVPTERELAGLGDCFGPYRSVAAWYCWRSADSNGRAGKD